MGRRWNSACGLLRIWNVSLSQPKAAGIVRVMAKVSHSRASIPGGTAALMTPGTCLHSRLWPSLYDELWTWHVNNTQITVPSVWPCPPLSVDSGLQIKPIATVRTRFSLSTNKVGVIVLVVLINFSLPSWTAGTRRARASSVSVLHRALSTQNTVQHREVAYKHVCSRCLYQATHGVGTWLEQRIWESQAEKDFSPSQLQSENSGWLKIQIICFTPK